MFVSGESYTGRTEFTKKSLKSKLIASPRESIVWCYAKVLQDLFEEILKKAWIMWKVFLENCTSISRRTKKISVYWMILWVKHQREL